jgi:glucose-1-phosphate adenylyltransferase
MSDFHGIIFAYSTAPGLGELVRTRTSSSLPFCGRYRLIDFALSSMANAGIYDVGVIMQRDYQSLLDHLGSGKDWDMSRRRGGLRMLPPFGLPDYHTGEYTGTIEALNAVATYIRDIPQKNIVMMPGNMAANLDLSAACARHTESGAELTAICCPRMTDNIRLRYIDRGDGFSERMLIGGSGEGIPSLEAYIISKKLLLSMMEDCARENRLHFHRNAIAGYLDSGGKICVYIHDGYAAPITDTRGYFRTSMDMLDTAKRSELFPPERPVRTKIHEEVSAYYGETAKVRNSLVADGCIIEGEISDCILFSGARVERGAKLDHCIVMRSGIVRENAQLKYVIADKYAELTPYITLTGSERLPIAIPKGSTI